MDSPCPLILLMNPIKLTQPFLLQQRFKKPFLLHMLRTSYKYVPQARARRELPESDRDGGDGGRVQVQVPDGPGHVHAVAAAHRGHDGIRGELRQVGQGQLPHRQGWSGRARQLGHAQGGISFASLLSINQVAIGYGIKIRSIESLDSIDQANLQAMR